MTVISLCDVTCNMVRPWLAAGFECWCVDIQHPRGVTKQGKLRKVGADIFELYRGHWWLPPVANIGFAFPDCTFLTISGNRWQRARGPGCVGRGLLFADACWRLLTAYGCPWMMENPAVGRLSTGWVRPDYTFHPWEYAGYLADIEIDNTTKNTGLWIENGFVLPPKRPAPEPHRHDCHDAPPSEDRADIRSATPMGFAYAIFEANQHVENRPGRSDETSVARSVGQAGTRQPPIPGPPHLRPGRNLPPRQPVGAVDAGRVAGSPAGL